MRYFAIVSYDGSQYAGWQSQPSKITVQGEIEKALFSLTKQRILIHGSGRTDAKVHALGQVFHFDSDMMNITCDGYKKALNALLPMDIRIKEVKLVSGEAHSRRDAIKKTYAYHINVGEYNVFQRNFALQLNRTLNIDKMKEASNCLIGTHDFSAFCANKKAEKENQVRTIYHIDISKEQNLVVIQYTGDGFMRYMVRMLTAALIHVGLNKITPYQLQQILESKNKEACNLNIDACGLYLVEVEYKHE